MPLVSFDRKTFDFSTPASRKTRRKRQGFTLVEMLVALVILTVALVLLVDLCAQGAQVTQKARFERIAVGIAQDWIEQLLGKPYAVCLVPLDRSIPVSDYYTSPLPPNATIRWIVRPLDNNAANTHLQEISVSVTWSGQPGAAMIDGSVNAFTLMTAKQ